MGRLATELGARDRWGVRTVSGGSMVLAYTVPSALSSPRKAGRPLLPHRSARQRSAQPRGG